jgi:hypothetical protein
LLTAFPVASGAYTPALASPMFLLFQVLFLLPFLLLFLFRELFSL